jgi:acetyltransferase-like isoleucine patch superfamily enzyme
LEDGALNDIGAGFSSSPEAQMADSSKLTTVGLGEVSVGRKCSIGERVTVVFSRPGTVRLGDYVALGDDVRIIVDGGEVQIGDWTTLHGDCLVMSTQGVRIGAHCWFGQNSVIDGTGGLVIGDGVRVGMFSQIWTHVAAGEQIEGCTLFAATPTVIEDDVWLVGTCTVGSGVTIGARTIALAGSNVTKSCPPASTVAGAPAKVKEGLSFYRPVTLDEKFAMLDQWLTEWSAGSPESTVSISDGRISVQGASGERVEFYKEEPAFVRALGSDRPETTICCVETKEYVKSFSALEKTVLKWLAGNKARFYEWGRRATPAV